MKLPQLATVFFLVLAVSATGCAGSWEPNRAKQERIFKECLAAVPPGPTHTQFNDWSEVIEACQDASRDISLEWVP